MVTCVDCVRPYPYIRGKGCTKTRCGGCQIRSCRKRLKEKAIAYKGGACCRCGYSKSMRALTFHHLNPSKKDFTIGKWRSLNWETIRKELDKCVMLCANCHAEEHEELSAVYPHSDKV